MADHFKLEIGASGTKITTFTNVEENFAEDFGRMLQLGKELKNTKLSDYSFPGLGQLESTNEDSSSSEDNTALSDSSDESKSNILRQTILNAFLPEDARSGNFLIIILKFLMSVSLLLLLILIKVILIGLLLTIVIKNLKSSSNALNASFLILYILQLFLG